MLNGYVNGTEAGFGGLWAVDSGFAETAVEISALGGPSRLFVGGTPAVNVLSFGLGGVTNVEAGKVSFITVHPFGGHFAKESVFDGEQALIEVNTLGQFPHAQGAIEPAWFKPIGAGMPHDGSEAIVLDQPFGSGAVRDGSPVHVDVLTEGQNVLLSGGVSFVDVTTPYQSLIPGGSSTDVFVQSESGSLIAGGAMPSVDVAEQGHGRPQGGAQDEIIISLEFGKAIRSGAIQSVPIVPLAGFRAATSAETAVVTVHPQGGPGATGGATPEITVAEEGSGVLKAGRVSDIVTVTYSGGTPSSNSETAILVSESAGGKPVDGAVSVVNILASAEPFIGGGSTESVEIQVETYFGVSAPSNTAGISVSVTADGKPVDGAVSVVGVIAASSFGLVWSDEYAPEARRVVVPPKDREVVFTGDDMSLKILKEFEKQPSEIVDYDFDLRQWFQKNADGDFIQEIEVAEVSPPGELVIGSDRTPNVVVFDDPPHQIKLWVSGGVSGHEYKVSVLFRTNIGRTEELDFLVYVEDI